MLKTDYPQTLACVFLYNLKKDYSKNGLNVSLILHMTRHPEPTDLVSERLFQNQSVQCFAD